MKPGDLVHAHSEFRGSRPLFNDVGGWAGDFNDHGIVLELDENHVIGKFGSPRAYAKLLSGGVVGWFRVEFLEVIG